MKKTICLLLAAILVLSLAACGAGNTNKAENGKQTASAYLNQSEDAVVEVTVDLSGGWSVEFVRGAVYLYDGEITAGKESVAMLITLDQEVYEEDLAKAMADGSHKEADSGIYFTGDGNRAAYLTALNDSAYILITAKDKAGMEAIVSRFMLALD